MIDLVVNGRSHKVSADPDKPLLWVLRDQLGLKGSKYGCGVGICGACVVLLDGEPNHACMVPLGRVGARNVTTIEGVSPDHAIVEAWIEEQVPQCGYCQPGQILSAVALLAKEPSPSDGAIERALSGVLCRCGTYQRILHAVRAAAHPKHRHSPVQGLPEFLSELPPDAGLAMNEWIWINPANIVTLMINHSEMGQGALTGLVALFAEELDIDPHRVRTVFAPANACYRNGLWGTQLTGGSSSIRGEWTRLRECAAKTRLRLLRCAAQRWHVATKECRTESGEVIHESSGRRVAYGDLADGAARLTLSRRVHLKDAADFRVIGQPIPRLDIPSMVLGRTRYGIDIAVAGMLVAAVARCPAFGGCVQRYDDRAALAVEGVRHVMQIASGVAVVADDFWSAVRGRDALRVDWQPGMHAELGSHEIERQLLAALENEGAVANERGGAFDFLGNTRPTIEAVYQTPYLAHAALEPLNCVAHVRPGACDVWVGTQHQEETQRVAAQIAHLPKSRVHVRTQFLGGGFGRRLETDFVAEAVELSKRLGAPVQVVWTRADDLQHDKYRPAHAVRLQAATDHRGSPLAWHMRIAGPELALDGIDVPYAIPHLREEHIQVECGVPTGPWRSVGASNNAFAIESFIDELAHHARRDPLEYRLALLQAAPRHAAVLREAVRHVGWGAAMKANHGRGIAVYESFGSVVADVAEVSVRDSAITVDRVVSVIDCGIAVCPDAVRAQLEGSVAFGLSAALKEEIQIAEGRVQQAGFGDYPILSFAEMPRVEVHILESDAAPGGVGEPGVPVIAPAVANAVFIATGERLRRMPLRLTLEHY